MSLLRREEEETDGIEVTWDDQQRINNFSKYNTRLSDIQSQLKRKKEEREYYDDLEMELELADEDGQVLYRIGEAFFHLTIPAANKHLKQDKAAIDKQVKQLERKADECEKEMKELKVTLYAKFGRQINLESNPAED